MIESVKILILCLSVIYGNSTSNGDEKETLLSSIHEALQLASTYSMKLTDFERLHTLMEFIKSKQQHHQHPFLSRSFSERISKIPDAQAYCSVVQHEHLQIEFFENFGVGVKVTNDIPIGTRLYTVPFNMTLNLIDYKPVFARLNDVLTLPSMVNSINFWTQNVWVTLGLLLELHKGNASPWKAYIDVLPNKFESVFDFEPNDMHLLEAASATYAAAVLTYSDMVVQYLTLYRYLIQNPTCCSDLYFTPESFTYDLYRWAFSVILSRTMGDANNLILVPCWDIVNHGIPEMDTNTHYAKDAANERHWSERSQVISNALIDLKSDQQLFHLYTHAASMTQVFTTWAMVDPRARMTIRVSLQESDPLYRTKRLKLARVNIATTYELTLLHDSEYPLNWKDFSMMATLKTGLLETTLTPKSWKKLWIYIARWISHAMSTYKMKRKGASEILDWQQGKIPSKHYKLIIDQIISEQASLKNLMQKSVAISKTDVRSFP